MLESFTREVPGKLWASLNAADWKYAAWIHAMVCLFVYFVLLLSESWRLTVMNALVRQGAFFKLKELDTFLPLTAQSLKGKDKKIYACCIRWKTDLHVFILFSKPQSDTSDLKFLFPSSRLLISMLFLSNRFFFPPPIRAISTTRVEENSTFENEFRILLLRTWKKFIQNSSDTDPAEVSASTSVTAKDPYVAPQSDNNEWSN